MIFITYTKAPDGSIDENVFDWDNLRWDSYNPNKDYGAFTTQYDDSFTTDILLRDAFTGLLSPPIVEMIMLENDSY